eukprot:GHVQ01030917.1.p1 GENE.GHVQ01030917.1~~GHVQ01030917.1.p1  ORF type:complete len:518 (+),score=80.89 GHVQ01030917.1:656-2209(+)
MARDAVSRRLCNNETCVADPCPATRNLNVPWCSSDNGKTNSTSSGTDNSRIRHLSTANVPRIVGSYPRNVIVFSCISSFVLFLCIHGLSIFLADVYEPGMLMSYDGTDGDYGNGRTGVIGSIGLVSSKSHSILSSPLKRSLSPLVSAAPLVDEQLRDVEEEVVMEEEIGRTVEEEERREGLSDGGLASEFDEKPRDVGVEGIIDPMEIEVNCENVKDFSRTPFSDRTDQTKVYSKPYPLRSEGDGSANIFQNMGFTKFVSVFGIPIVAEDSVDDSILEHAAMIFARFIDNDEDGKPDRPDSLRALHVYNTVIGYVSGPDSSERLWSDKFPDGSNKSFREQFVCKMHFFEQWATDATPNYHARRSASVARPDDDSDDELDKKPVCTTEMKESDFDWPLWYFPFTLTYYGYLEDFDEVTLSRIEQVMETAKAQGVFIGDNYPDDKDMELSDFIVWSVITKLGALECHCESDEISEGWRLCTADDVHNFDERWFVFLDQSLGLPKVLPDGSYKGEGLIDS